MPAPDALTHELYESPGAGKPAFAILQLPWPLADGVQVKPRVDNGLQAGRQQLLLQVPGNSKARESAVSWLRALGAELESIAAELEHHG